MNDGSLMTQRLKRYRIVLLSAILIAAGGASDLEAGLPASLRVYRIAPAEFDYQFTAVVGGGANPVLSLNHRSGRTYFVRIGDSLDGWRVKAFEPMTNRAFNASVNSYMETKSGKVTLLGRDGQTTLEMGKPVPQPGWMAWLADLSTGQACNIREKDEIPFGTVNLAITSISESAVTASVGGETQTVPPISEEERKDLVELWNRIARERDESRTRAIEQDIQEREAALAEVRSRQAANPFQAITPREKSGASFGTEFRYPVEFQVVPPVLDVRGKEITPGFAVPSRFETRMIGSKIEAQ